MPLELYNTMGRTTQEFIPLIPGKVSFYGCGPTVYNYAHIGNLRAFVFQDTLARSLRFLGYEVTHVMNVTDIGHLTDDADDGEDKMVTKARERGQSVLEIADFYTKAFFDDIDRLNIQRPSIMCRATDHIQQMIDLITRIEANGHTYFAGGNLYFDVSTFADYGALAHFNHNDSTAEARVEIDTNKRNPFDFVLWFTKSKFENQALVWDSPWGRGYPGWHIECSAMSMKYLGEQFDIHTGGIDHIQIHHTNEIAQSEGATGKKWVNYWLHNEFLIMNKGKMSKSAGNFLTLQYLIDQGFDPLDYRFFLLGGHYRSQLTFSWESMESARNSRRNLVQRIARLMETSEPEQTNLKETSKAHEWLNRFRANIEQDISMPRALSELQGLIRDTEVPAGEAIEAIDLMDAVLGLELLNSAKTLLKESKLTNKMDDAQIKMLIDERGNAKIEKNYAKADEIRNQLKENGIILEDTPSGTTWRRSVGETL